MAAGRRQGDRRQGSREFSSHGVSDDLAHGGDGLYQYSLLDVIDIADIIDRDPRKSPTPTSP